MDEEQFAVVEAIRQLRQQIRWKPGSADRHLLKRVELGHLLEDPETYLANTRFRRLGRLEELER